MSLGFDRVREAEQELLRLSAECSVLSSVSTLLEWDEEIAMPSGGVEARSRQLALLAGLEHERFSSLRFSTLLDVVESDRSMNLARAVNVRELRKLERRHQKLDRKFVEELVRVRTLAQHQYAEALEQSNFSLFAPWLEHMLILKREEAARLSEGASLYDTLLDELEPGMTSEFLEKLFRALAPELKNILGRALGSTRQQPPADYLARNIPAAQQHRFAKETIAALGFDFHRGRLDEARHPFTVRVAPGDCRISTRFLPEDFSEGFFCGLHELGHGLYDQGLPEEYFGAPIGEPASLGMHEAQARFWENIVGRRRSFWAHFYPRMQAVFSPHFDSSSEDQFFAAINRVAPTLRRVRADEVTYNLHVMIRFDLERALLDGRLAVSDLPAAWSAAYREHLGLTPPDDASGVLQDGHWSSGTFGYFPTYTLGNVVAAQLFAAARAELGDLDDQFARGNFADLLGWLRKKIHRRGRELAPDRLVFETTGEEISPRALIQHLSDKVAAIYG